MIDERRERILAEIAQFTQPPVLQEDEFTVAHFAEYSELPYATAGRYLVNLLREGAVTRREVVHDGKRKWAYRKADREDNAEESSEAVPASGLP